MPSTGPAVCQKCARKVDEDWRVCPSCAAPLDGATQTVFTPAPSSSSMVEGRFPAGTMLAARYRIMGLLGRGGMGEVYRAYDTILDQSVALKFLPQANVSESALARFRNEVRMARQVAHPNVCRVYDIGFVQGQHFLSMEYLDGEDLESLLRRIGRLPQDKAIEFTRRICAGLSAAHERGVLHRDLKPSNIMIDGRGQVRITDFGLAALAAEIPLSDLRSGTPAYMSPEQKAGREVTARSDVYSLGLVLHEMFTGKYRGNAQSSPAELVKDLDPAIECVILRCLEEEPKRRPQSPLHVAMALPGGDPIAAALAAGETPSPEMVAASQEKEGFSQRTAVLCFAAILFCTVAIHVYPNETSLSRAKLEIPPEALADRAQEMLRRFGYTARPPSAFYGFRLVDLRSRSDIAAVPTVAAIAQHHPGVMVGFWYRQHTSEIVANSFPGGTVKFDSPANDQPGMIQMDLDATGRLLRLEARPEESAGMGPSSPATDWNTLLLAAQFEPARLQPVSPQQTPSVMADSRMAWTGALGNDRTGALRVEAASWQGRPVYFQVSGDWQQQNSPTAGSRSLFAIVILTLGMVILAGASFLAWQNLRQGRSDRRGAARVATTMFVGWMVVWILTADHATAFGEAGLVIKALCFGTFLAGLYGAVYLAVEPYARRYWPAALIPATRLIAGRVRDPLVASNVLAGILVVHVWAFILVVVLPVLGFRAPPSAPPEPTLEALRGAPALIGILILEVGLGASIAALAFFVGLLARILVHREWVADGLLVLLLAFLFMPAGLLIVALNCLLVAVGLWLLRRLGLLVFLTAGAHVLMGGVFHPFSNAPGSWYAGRALILPAFLITVSAWALWVIVSAQQRPPSTASGT